MKFLPRLALTPLVLFALALLSSCGSSTPSAPAPVLTCPNAGTLPFTTESSAFVNPSNAGVYDARVFDQSADLDFIGHPGDDVVVRGNIVVVGGENANAVGDDGKAIAGEALSLWAWVDGAWKQLGRTTTGEDGGYTIDLGATSGLGVGENRVYAVLEGAQTCYPHGVFLWPAKTQIVVADIDGTLNADDAEFFKTFADPTYDGKIMGHGPELTRAWADKGYKVVYLSARPDAVRTATRAWLARHGFAYGALITSADLLLMPQPTTEYKTAALANLSDTLGYDLVAAYGNATTDIAAYEMDGIPKAHTFIIGENAGMDGTVAIDGKDYESHIAGYVDAQPDATQPSKRAPETKSATSPLTATRAPL